MNNIADIGKPFPQPGDYFYTMCTGATIHKCIVRDDFMIHALTFNTEGEEIGRRDLLLRCNDFYKVGKDMLRAKGLIDQD